LNKSGEDDVLPMAAVASGFTPALIFESYLLQEGLLHMLLYFCKRILFNGDNTQ
jgi:hypothetical protein